MQQNKQYKLVVDASRKINSGNAVDATASQGNMGYKAIPSGTSGYFILG